PHRRAVEKYAKPEAWVALTPEAIAELSDEVAGLPTELEAESEEAKRFDLLVLNLQLALLRADKAFERLRERVKEIAALLTEKDAIPMVHAQMALIQEVLTDAWWQDVTVPMLESLRRRLRALVQFIDKRQRKVVYTDFEDQMGSERAVSLPGLSVGTDLVRFRDKARAFLRQHLNHIAVQKVRLNRPLTATDLAELERMLVESGVGDAEDVRQAAERSQGLGLFVRSLVGLDRAAAKEALAGFLAGKTLTANQIEFVNLIIDDLAENGFIEPARLYESPFIDVGLHGPEGVFDAAQVTELLSALEAVRATARAA
ncbi:MAG: restriction endonuclease subunit R, partial [Burkholderiaceae bacterium]|nr:restriction endonuclease subunit R [Burkholderiaceae bacterium]